MILNPEKDAHVLFKSHLFKLPYGKVLFEKGLIEGYLGWYSRRVLHLARFVLKQYSQRVT